MLSKDIESQFLDIENTSKNVPFAVLQQILATTSFMRQIYENSVDLADLVV